MILGLDITLTRKHANKQERDFKTLIKLLMKNTHTYFPHIEANTLVYIAMVEGNVHAIKQKREVGGEP